MYLQNTFTSDDKYDYSIDFTTVYSMRMYNKYSIKGAKNNNAFSQPHFLYYCTWFGRQHPQQHLHPVTQPSHRLTCISYLICQCAVFFFTNKNHEGQFIVLQTWMWYWSKDEVILYTFSLWHALILFMIVRFTLCITSVRVIIYLSLFTDFHVQSSTPIKTQGLNMVYNINIYTFRLFISYLRNSSIKRLCLFTQSFSGGETYPQSTPTAVVKPSSVVVNVYYSIEHMLILLISDTEMQFWTDGTDSYTEGIWIWESTGDRWLIFLTFLIVYVKLELKMTQILVEPTLNCSIFK